MYKVKLLKDLSLQKLEEEINKFIETLGLINGVDVNISVLNIEDAMLEYIATIIYKSSDLLT
jgi:hypothetical protein